jgi:hypothetical protein
MIAVRMPTCSRKDRSVGWREIEAAKAVRRQGRHRLSKQGLKAEKRFAWEYAGHWLRTPPIYFAGAKAATAIALIFG